MYSHNELETDRYEISYSFLPPVNFVKTVLMDGINKIFHFFLKAIRSNLLIGFQSPILKYKLL